MSTQLFTLDEINALAQAKALKVAKENKRRENARLLVAEAKKLKGNKQLADILDFDKSKQITEDSKKFAKSLKGVCLIICGYKNDFCGFTANQLMKYILDNKIQCNRVTSEGVWYYSVNTIKQGLQKHIRAQIKANKGK